MDGVLMIRKVGERLVAVLTISRNWAFRHGDEICKVCMSLTKNGWDESKEAKKEKGKKGGKKKEGMSNHEIMSRQFSNCILTKLIRN